MTLAEMFADQDELTFQQRRDEVVALVSSATDLVGADHGLRAFFDAMCRASDEREFDDAFDTLVTSIESTSLRASAV
jgi:hypothetical protein